MDATFPVLSDCDIFCRRAQGVVITHDNKQILIADYKALLTCVL